MVSAYAGADIYLYWVDAVWWRHGQETFILQSEYEPAVAVQSALSQSNHCKLWIRLLQGMFGRTNELAGTKLMNIS